jgi:hypothetical protein
MAARLRHNPADFRNRVIKAYGFRCAISGVETRCTLDAAHISPYDGPISNDIGTESACGLTFIACLMSACCRSLTIIGARRRARQR